MVLGQTKAISLLGMDGYLVTVEVHISNALPSFTLIGLPDAALNEARDRVRAAIVSCGFTFPARRVTVNLAPAALPKSGSGYDLAIALSVLSAAEILKGNPPQDIAFFGELGLDGRVHAVRGALPAVMAAKAQGIKRVVIAQDNLAEARLVRGIEAVGVRHLAHIARELGAAVDFPEDLLPQPETAKPHSTSSTSYDLAEVVGQGEAKTALEIAAAGGHNLFMVGPPGTGKTMLAQRLPTILPELSPEQALEVASIRSLSGHLNLSQGLSFTPPFEAPHHTATAAALIGGGSNTIRPGMISRAHRGVLFLDEAPEFSSRVLQTLRQPLEGGSVTIARAAGTAVFPAKFQLVAAANPCPCGNAYGKGMGCQCTSLQQRRYMQRLSGPLLDRVDLQVAVVPVNSSLGQSQVAEASATVRERVTRARLAAADRMKTQGWSSNSEARGSWIRAQLGMRSPAIRQVNGLVDRGILSMRGADRVLRVAWTIADLGGFESPGENEIHQAVALRTRIGANA